MPVSPPTFKRNKVAAAQHQHVGRRTAAQRGYDGQWQKARAHYLTHHPLCVDCAERNMTVAATRVDHIKPHRGDMELFWDVTNWQGLCEKCHNRKSAAERTSNMAVSYRPKWLQQSLIPVQLVAGCYGVGKSRWVDEVLGKRDLVVDLPILMAKVAGTDVHQAGLEVIGQAIAERNQILGRLANPHFAKRYDRCYLVQATPEARVRRWWRKKLGCNSIVLMAEPDVCRQRILDDPLHPDKHADLVDKWFADYTTDFEDEVIDYG